MFFSFTAGLLPELGERGVGKVAQAPVTTVAPAPGAAVRAPGMLAPGAFLCIRAVVLHPALLLPGRKEVSRPAREMTMTCPLQTWQ